MIHDRFYWLAVDKEAAGKRPEVVVELKGQTIEIVKPGVSKLTIRLNDQMVDMDKEIKVVMKGKELFRGKVARNIKSISQTLREDGDPKAVYFGQLEVDLQ